MNVAAVVALACVALAGCGSGSKTTSTATASTSPALTAAGAPAVVASGIPFASNLAFDSQGRLWVAAATLGPSPTEGVWYVPASGPPRHVAGNLTAATGIAAVENRIYVGNTVHSGSGQITVLEGFTGTGFTHRRVLIRDLPIGSRTIGTIVRGPDGRLYAGLGALADHTGPAGRVISFAPSGGTPVVQATGVRTAYGLAFWGRKLLVTDNGPDEVGPAPDLLLDFEPSGTAVDFGFPKCYGQGGPACAGVTPPLTTFPPHTAPAGVAVKGDIAYVAGVGSAVPGSTTPSAITAVDLQTGKHTTFWNSPVKHDVVGLAIGPEGDLYATLVVSGEVVRFKL